MKGIWRLLVVTFLTGLSSCAKTCNLDEHHDKNGGFYVEGIAGSINSQRDLETGKRADNGTWAANTYYPHGEMKLCTGMFCSEESRTKGSPQYVVAHTCARLRFTYKSDSGSTVYELPSQAALDACDFSEGVLRGAANAGDPEFDVLIDVTHDKKIYYYASLIGCQSGQKVAVQVVDDYDNNFAVCKGMGVGSSRIKHCDCNHQLKQSTLVDPCHTAFVYGCLSDMPNDLSCCPDPEKVTYDSASRKYVHSEGGSTGSCISKSKLAEAMSLVPVLKDLMANNPTALVPYDHSDSCPSIYDPKYDAKCNMYKTVQKCQVDTPPADCSTDPNWVAWTTPAAAETVLPPGTKSFTDDNGITHTWTKAQPKIVTGVFDAISLMHMGMKAGQILGTFGERSTSGSNFGAVYHDQTGANGAHGNHGEAVYNALNFPADPDLEERAMLAQAHDLSADCSATNFYCVSFDHTILDQHGWPDLIIEGAYHGPYALHGAVIGNATQRGIRVIRITRQYHTAGTEPKGFIEITERYEALAKALGVENVDDTVMPSKKQLCAQVTEFKSITKNAQERGVRSLAAYVPYGPPAANGDQGGFLMSPDKDPVLLMLEELGMPILHVDATQDASWEYMVEADWSAGTMSATNLMSSGGRTGGRVKVPYPTDFFLYDIRTVLEFTSDKFAVAWPHPAVVQKQYAYWPSGGHIHSYEHAVDILRLVGEKLDTAKKINPMETKCTPVDVIDSHMHRTTGLAPGEYACWDPVTYDWCFLGINAVPDWKVKATQEGWIPCGKSKAAALLRRLSKLETQGADSKLLKEARRQLNPDFDEHEDNQRKVPTRQDNNDDDEN